MNTTTFMSLRTLQYTILRYKKIKYLNFNKEHYLYYYCIRFDARDLKRDMLHFPRFVLFLFFFFV